MNTATLLQRNLWRLRRALQSARPEILERALAAEAQALELGPEEPALERLGSAVGGRETALVALAEAEERLDRTLEALADLEEALAALAALEDERTEVRS